MEINGGFGPQLVYMTWKERSFVGVMIVKSSDVSSSANETSVPSGHK